MLWAVIMAGGSGTRFWPESREKNPKQFLQVFGQETLLEQTVSRLKKNIPSSRILVITQKNKVALSRKLLKSLPPSHIIGEPVGRNTAPCAVLAAAIALKKDPKAIIGLFPADHLISKPSVFKKAVAAATKIAWEEKLPVTFGIKPSFPHSGYGYLEMDKQIRRVAGFAAYRLKRFHEKPSHKKAVTFVRSKRFLWNSGMFVWRADELLKTAQRYLPAVERTASKIVKGNFAKNMERFFKSMPNVSIDYGLMEKMKGKILTMPMDLGWSDLGGWHSLHEIFPQDAHGNITIGSNLLIESSGNIVKSNDRLVALLGVKDLVVIDTPDALMICPKEQTESIRSIVKELRQRKWKQYL